MSLFGKLAHGNRAPEAANDNAEMAPDIVNVRYDVVNDVMKLLDSESAAHLEELKISVVANDNTPEEMEVAA